MDGIERENQGVKGACPPEAGTALSSSGSSPVPGLAADALQSAGALNRIAIQIEDILGNGPMNEPKSYPTVGYSHGYHGNDPDAPDDTVPEEAFNEGHARGWWEACQMLEPVLAALREQAERHGDDWFAGEVDCDGNELITIRKDEWERLNGAYLSAVKGRQDFRAAYREAREPASVDTRPQDEDALAASLASGAVGDSRDAQPLDPKGQQP